MLLAVVTVKALGHYATARAEHHVALAAVSSEKNNHRSYNICMNLME